MRFRVALSIAAGWRIPSDSVARIGSTSFLAAKTIDIESGRADRAIQTGGEIPSGAPRDMFAAMANVAAEVGDLSRLGVKPLVEQLGAIVVRTGETLDGLTRTVEHRTPEFLDRLSGLITRLDASAAGPADGSLDQERGLYPADHRKRRGNLAKPGGDERPAG